MNYIKIAAIVLCVVLLGAGLAADQSSAEGFTPGYDTKSAMAKYPPDTVMLSAGDIEVTWGEFYFLLHNTAAQVTGGFQYPTDWKEDTGMGESLGESMLNYVISEAERVLIYRYAIDLLGITIDDEELQSLDEYIDNIIESTGGTNNIEEELQYEGFINLDVFRAMLLDDTLQGKLPAELYGPYYDEISDELVEDYINRNQLMCAKHILFSFPSESEGYTAAEVEKAKKEAREKAEDVLGQLNAKKNSAGFEEFFTEMVEEHSEDPGSLSFPNGYLFQPYEMVEEFSNATTELTPGEMSGIVESNFGFHIILRLPVNYDDVPYSLMSQGQYYTLRQLTVFEDFDNRIIEWQEAIDVTKSSRLESLDVAKLFAWRE